MVPSCVVPSLVGVTLIPGVVSGRHGRGTRTWRSESRHVSLTANNVDGTGPQDGVVDHAYGGRKRFPGHECQRRPPVRRNDDTGQCLRSRPLHDTPSEYLPYSRSTGTSPLPFALPFALPADYLNFFEVL